MLSNYDPSRRVTASVKQATAIMVKLLKERRASITPALHEIANPSYNSAAFAQPSVRNMATAMIGRAGGAASTEGIRISAEPYATDLDMLYRHIDAAELQGRKKICALFTMAHQFA